MLYEKIKMEADETIMKVVRKHWFIIVAELFATFLMLLLPFVLLFVIALIPDTISQTGITLGDYTALITFGVATWSVLTLMSGFMIWTHYYLDLWIITDRRIILVDQITFFNRNVSIFRLERLQDIEFYQKGIIATLLNFGTLRAQTASAFDSNFKTNGLPNPRGLQSVIQNAMDARLDVLHRTNQPIE